MPKKKPATRKQVESFVHEDANRRNIPTAEFEAVVDRDDRVPVRVAYERRNRDLDPQLVWRGKDEQDWSDLVVPAPPLYIQEKVHPKVLIDDLLRQTEHQSPDTDHPNQAQLDLFGDFNGLLSEEARTEFYQHDSNWTNRMILGDSLQVMASLAEREGLRGKVQCIYLDPPYGIKFNSNFQWSTTSRDVKDGKQDHITREPEMVKAFRDTWRDGIHTYLTYLRDRLTVARDLLTDSDSVFVQIGDENVHRVRALMEEVFGEENFVSQIHYSTTSAFSTSHLSNNVDYILFFAKSKEALKYRPLIEEKLLGGEKSGKYRSVRFPDGAQRPLTAAELEDASKLPDDARIFTLGDLVSNGWSKDGSTDFQAFGDTFVCPSNSHWKTSPQKLPRLLRADRLQSTGKRIMFRRYLNDYSASPLNNIWTDTSSGFSTSDPKVYVVQTRPLTVKRCLLMATDPGDLVLDPTCGSGTTAYVAEQWGRRWITIDTSRVALALARARIMGARYPFYLLSDSKEGQQKEAELTRSAPSEAPTHGRIRQGFVYERVPHITLKSIANNAEIDVIWEEFQPKLEALRQKINETLETKWEEWEIPRNLEAASCHLPSDKKRLEAASTLLSEWWDLRIARQKEIDASIAAKADQEFLYDKPYEDKKKVRVAGPFTVESLSPHRVVGVDEDDELIDKSGNEDGGEYGREQDFSSMILDNLRTAGVQQARKEGKIDFSTLAPWPGRLVCAEGRYAEGESETEKRAAIFIGPEFGTVSRADLVEAAREAAEAGFDVLIACAFNYEARTTEFDKLGSLPVLKARMNADLHMSDELKNTGKGNLFVIFGEPDIDILDAEDGKVQVRINGVDVFKPQSGKVESAGPDEIACWFIDTDYNEESFFVRQAYFLGANDPYKSLKTTLKAEIDEEAWETLNSDTSRPFRKPTHGRIAVKVINHLGDEVMKVFRV